MPGDELVQSQNASAGSRGQKRELKGYHAPWETTPAHCLDLDSGRSTVDEIDLAKFWAYLAKPANTVKYKSECPVTEGCRVSVFALQVRWRRQARWRGHQSPRSDFVDGYRSAAGHRAPHPLVPGSVEVVTDRHRGSGCPGAPPGCFCMFHSRTALVDGVVIAVACMFV